MTPEREEELSRYPATYPGIEGRWAEAMGSIATMRLELKDLELGRKAWEDKAHELQATLQNNESASSIAASLIRGLQERLKISEEETSGLRKELSLLRSSLRHDLYD